jgi:parallel beta-helix repeat protein
MPGAAAEVIANFTEDAKYTLTVTDGDGDGDYYEGQIASFSGWTTESDGVIHNASAESTTFVMPGAAAEVIANFTEVTTYTLTVESVDGSVAEDLGGGNSEVIIGSRNYPAGTSVDLMAVGMLDPLTTFIKWEILSDPEVVFFTSGPELTINMDSDRTVKAYFRREGDTYYVDGLNGEDSIERDGTINEPFKTITYAQTFLRAGNTLKIYRSTYNETPLFDEPGIIIEALDNEVILDAGGTTKAMAVGENGYNITIKGLKFTNASNFGLYVEGDNVTLEKCEAYNNGVGIYAQDADGLVIRDCAAHENDGAGFELSSCNGLLVEGSISYNNSGGYGFAITSSEGAIVRQCVATANGFSGFNASGSALAGVSFYHNT